MRRIRPGYYNGPSKEKADRAKELHSSSRTQKSLGVIKQANLERIAAMMTGKLCDIADGRFCLTDDGKLVGPPCEYCGFTLIEITIQVSFKREIGTAVCQRCRAKTTLGGRDEKLFICGVPVE